MRINLLSCTLSIVLLTQIITVVQPSAALAQQTSDSVLAVFDAQRDAKDDVNNSFLHHSDISIFGDT